MSLEDDDTIPAIPIVPAIRAATADDQATNNFGQTSPVDSINPSVNKDIAFTLSATEKSQRPANLLVLILCRLTRLGHFTHANQAML